MGYTHTTNHFYSHVNYSVTKIWKTNLKRHSNFYSHVNYSVTKIYRASTGSIKTFYSHVNYSVTKMVYWLQIF